MNAERDYFYKVGILMIGEERYEKYEGLKDGLVNLGYNLNNFTFIVKNANDDPDLLKKQIDELLAEDLDQIVTLGGIETIELKKAMDANDLSIPVVFAGVAAPKEVGLVKDFHSPGGNFTGINNYHTSLSGKRLEMLNDLVPSIERVLVLFDQEVEVSRLSLGKTIEAGKALGITIIPFNVSDDNYYEKIQRLVKENDALFILPSFRLEIATEEIVKLSKTYRIPVMGLFEHEVASGYLASYGTSFYSQGYQAARFVSSIFQGNSPDELPVELPDSVRFLVNEQVVDELNIALNTELIYFADFVKYKAGGEY